MEGDACAGEELELTHEMCGLLPLDVSMTPRMTMVMANPNPSRPEPEP